MYKDRILDKYEQIKLKHVRLEGLTKQEVLSMQIGEEILKAAYEPKYTKEYLVEDLKEAIKRNSSIKISKDLYDKIMKINNGTIVFATQEIYKGIIIFDVTKAEDMGDII